MFICKHVHERCCTLNDEIKMSKLWHGRTKPLLESHMDRVIHYMKSVTKSFTHMGYLDPRLMLLKYIKTEEVKVRKMEYCSSNLFKEVVDSSNPISKY